MPAGKNVDVKKAADKVDRARRAIERAIRPVVALLGDDDLTVVNEAFFVLRDLGGHAILTPLAEGLAMADTDRHKLAILSVLIRYGRGRDIRAVRALMAARAIETNPRTFLMLEQAIFQLMMPMPRKSEDRAESPTK